MASTKRRWAVQTFTGKPSPEAAAFTARKRDEDAFEWPAEPDERVWVWGVADGYVVDVELVRTEDDELIPVGVAIRRTFPTSRHKKHGFYPFVEDAVPEGVSAVDVRRIPIGRALRAALTAARSLEPTPERHQELERILVPRGRPQRGSSQRFYRDLAEVARRLKRRGLSPAKEIAARRPDVDENLVHQWLYVARHTYGEEI